jgi:hypothetical protein
MGAVSEEKFTILSLDGGGVRGYLAAKILENIENYLNSRDADRAPIGKRFDLIAGTSTGGIIALGLALGRTASEIASFYKENIPAIFGATQKRNCILQLLKPKYQSAALEKSLTEFFGNSTLKNVQTDVCVVSLSLQNAKARIYKSDYLARNIGRLDEKLVDIALATSAAPTYFAAHSTQYSTNLVDGGVCANNPSMIALVDAFQFERPSKRGIKLSHEIPNGLKKVVMLSIGTGEQCEMRYKLGLKRLSKGGLLNWGSNFYKVSIESQSQLVHAQTKFFLREPYSYMRINPQLKFSMDIDDIENVSELLNLADLTRETEIVLKQNF